MGRIDLEQYDHEPWLRCPIRATEGTVLPRIPPRVAVRENAPIELPMDAAGRLDPGRTRDRAAVRPGRRRWPLYDFDLMERAGTSGLGADPAQWEQTARALAALADPDAFNARYRTSGLPVMLFAGGMGNHPGHRQGGARSGRRSSVRRSSGHAIPVRPGGAEQPP